MQEIVQPEELESVIGKSAEQPLFLFKHSTRCPISAGAYRRVSDFLADADDAGNEHPPVYLINVVESRPVSNAIQKALGVIHQSPQLILVKDGKSVWSTSHHNINADNIHKAIAEASV